MDPTVATLYRLRSSSHIHTIQRTATTEAQTIQPSRCVPFSGKRSECQTATRKEEIIAAIKFMLVCLRAHMVHRNCLHFGDPVLACSCTNLLRVGYFDF